MRQINRWRNEAASVGGTAASHTGDRLARPSQAWNQLIALDLSQDWAIIIMRETDQDPTCQMETATG